MNFFENLLSPDNRKKTLLIIAVLAVVIRLIYVFAHDPIPEPYQLNLDDVDFNYLGKSIAEGRGMTDKYGDPTMTRFPAYCYFLGMIYALFGYHIYTAFVIQALLGCLTPLLVYHISREFFKHRIALLASLLTACYPSFVVYSTRIMSENLFIPEIALLIYLTLRYKKAPSLKLSALLGLTLGVSALTRGVLYPMIMISPLIIFILAKGIFIDRLKHVVLAALMIVAAFSPWLLRNHYHYGKIFHTSSGGGPILWMSYFPLPVDQFFQMDRAYAYVDSVGRENVEVEKFFSILVNDNIFGMSGMSWYFEELFPDREWPQNEADFSDAVFDLLKDRLSENPGIFVIKHVMEFLRFWHFVDDRGDYVIAYALILPFFLAGLWLLRRRWREFSLIMLFFIYIMIMETAFTAAARYRMSFETIMIVIGSYAIWQFFSKIRPITIPLIVTTALLSVNVYFSYNDFAFRKTVRAIASSVGLPVMSEDKGYIPDLESDMNDESFESIKELNKKKDK